MRRLVCAFVRKNQKTGFVATRPNFKECINAYAINIKVLLLSWLFRFSVTEREISRGILKAKNVDDHCLAYIREIENINVTLLRFAAKFIDFAARNVDGEAQKLLKTLRDDKLPAKMTKNNLVRFKVEWGGKEGIDMETHREYLETFTQHFYTAILALVDAAMAKNERLSSDPVYVEVLQHLNACANSCKVFQGREDIVEQIKVMLF